MSNNYHLKHAKEILKYFDDIRDVINPNYDVVGNAFGLLARFVVLSGDDEVYQTSVKLFRKYFDGAHDSITEILEESVDGAADYLVYADYGQLSNILYIGKDAQDVKKFREPFGRKRFQQRAYSLITTGDIPKLHHLFYGFTQKCSNVLDLLIIEVKAAGLMSYCLSRYDPWMLVLDLCNVRNSPTLDNIDANNVKILKNWCSLIRATLAGNFYLLRKMDSELVNRYFEPFIDFAHEHCEGLLLLQQTLNVLREEDGCLEAVAEIYEMSKLTLCRCISQGVIHLFFLSKRLLGSAIKNEAPIRTKILDITKKVMLGLDIGSTFEFMKSVLQLVYHNGALHDAAECANNFLLDIFCEIYLLLRRDEGNWSEYISHCLMYMPVGFCSCIAPHELFNKIRLPVYGNDLKSLKRLVFKHFVDAEEYRFTKRPVENYKVDYGMGNWLKEGGSSDWKDIIDIVERVTFMFDDVAQAEMARILIHFYLDHKDDELHEQLLTLFHRKFHSTQVVDQITELIVLEQIEGHALNPELRISFFNLLFKITLAASADNVLKIVEESWTFFSSLLKKALADIWVFSSSSASVLYHAFCDLLVLFRHVLKHGIVVDHHKSRILSDANKLCGVCVDALIPSDQTAASNHKIATMISLATRCVVFDKKSFARLRDVLIENGTEYVLSTAVLAVDLVLYARDTICPEEYEDFGPCCSSSFDGDGEISDKSEDAVRTFMGGQLSCSAKDMVYLALDLVAVSLKKTQMIEDEHEEQKLLFFFDILRADDCDPDNDARFKGVIDTLFDILEAINLFTQTSERLKTAVLRKIGEFIAAKPEAKTIARILKGAFNGSRAMENVALSLQTLLQKRAVEPAECIQIPQRPFAPCELPDPAPIPSRILPSAAACFVLDPVHRIFLSEGMSISFWISIAAFSKLKTKRHIVSIGAPQLNLQLWMQPVTGNMVLRVNVMGRQVKQIEANKMFDGQLKTWENICLGLQATENNVKVMALFGDKLTEIEGIDNEGIPQSSPFEICIGEAVESDFLAELSFIYAFKGVLSEQCAIISRSLGCESQCLTECRSGNLFNCFSKCMTKNLITNKHSGLLDVWSDPKKFVCRLQRSVLFVLQASSAHCYGLSVLQRGVDSDKLNKIGESVLCLTMYKDFPVEWHSPIIFRKQVTLDIALRAIGSIKVFIFLYALSVDKQYDAKAQLEALRLLFKALRRSALNYGEFRNVNGLHMLTQIMNTANAHLDDQIFDELSKFLFSDLETDERGTLQVSFYTVISEPEFLMILLSTTDLWKNDNFKYWARLIQLTATSIDTCKAKFFDFNSQLLHRVEFLKPLLNGLLDMQQKPGLFTTAFLNHPIGHYFDDQDPLTVYTRNLVSGICAVVSELISSPFRCQSVQKLWNYILLSHPAQDTYLDFALRGHADWIRPEDVEFVEDEDETDVEPVGSLLSAFFEKVLMNFDKDKIADLWNNKNSVVEVRKEILKTEQDYRIFMLPTQRLDSVCPILHGNNDTGIDLEFAGLRRKDFAQVDHWLTTLRTDLLSTMCNIVLSCEDSLMAVVELDVLTWKTIIVQLTNQPHRRIRNLIFLLLQNFFLRCADKYRLEFVKQHGFLLLANQLRKFPVGYEIADSLFSIFCGECVKIRDGLDEEHLETIEATSFRYASFHCLFALLEASVMDRSLFWTVCSTLQKIFEANALLRRAMVDCGITDTMINVLRLLCVQQTTDARTMIGPVFPLTDCWVSFSRSIVTLIIPYRDPYMYSRAQDFLWLCQIIDYQLSNTTTQVEPGERLRKVSQLTVQPSTGCADCARQMVRRALCQLIDCWIDSIQTIVLDANNMIPVDERLDPGNESSDDSTFEIYYSDSQFTSSSYYGDGDKAEKKKRTEFASIDELSRRLCFALQIANDLFVFGQIPEVITEKEEYLFQSYLDVLVAPWKRKHGGEHMKDYNTVLALSKEKCRTCLAELIAYVLFPVQVRRNPVLNGIIQPEIDEASLLRRRLAIVKCLSELHASQDCLTSLLDVNLDYQYSMKISLHELALCPQYESIWEEYAPDLDKLIRFLRTLQLESPLANLTREEIRSLTTDEVILLHTYSKKRGIFATVLKENSVRLAEKDNPLIKAVKDNAVALTCTIAELQNEPRKLHMQSRKNSVNSCAKANEVLASLVVELTHPEAPFHDAASWPQGQSLDPTENMHRERKRLRPDHYRFEMKFLKKSQQEKVGATAVNAYPLQNLCESCPNFATTDYIEASNHVISSLSATLIRTAFECSGEIIISERKIHFLGEEARSTQKGSVCSPVTLAWSYQQLSEVYSRFFLLKDTALELFTTTGDAFLVVFKSTADRDSFLNQLKKMGYGALMADDKHQLKVANEMWRRGSITNFDYLMTLNKLAGRSFNDLMQYPVFPFILANYTSVVLDLNSNSSFRDLQRPMAIQNKAMEQYYVDNYRSLSEEVERHKGEVESFFSSCFGAYNYGSHYSNTGIVAHYLVRVSPFTNVALEYQDNNFDIPDRLFNSVATTWRLSSSESTTDFKELIPEFFYLPEMFQNLEKLDLGVRQAGSEVDDVLLANWCPKNDPRLFCLIHRQALESQYVTINMHHWIDLIFGFKQQGAAAIKAVNVFHPATYRGRDLEGERVHDEITLSALKTMVRTYGQMPHQLFLSPHLPHLHVSKNSGSSENKQLLFNIKGLKWGDFVGSPDVDQRHWMVPVFTLSLGSHDNIGRLFPVYKENFCYGLPDKTELVIRRVVDSRDPMRKAFEVTTTAIVSWRFSDNVLRIKLVQMDDSVWINLIDLQMFEPTQVVYSPNTDLLYIGTSCGLIRVYSIEYKTESKIWYVKLVNEFFAHKSSISSLKVCDNFHIVLSASVDGMACLWDSNRLTYIRTLHPGAASENEETITMTATSPISADIAIVYQSGRGSRLVLYTVNGNEIGTYMTGPELTISSIAMTNMEEGAGINCIAIGLQNGVIRLLETWTLSLVCDINCNLKDPVIGMEFTHESKRLYAALASGKILCWQIPISNPTQPSAGARRSNPTFRMLNPFI